MPWSGSVQTLIAHSAWVWTIGQINAGSGATLTLTVTVNQGTSGQTLKTFATITGLDQTDSNPTTSAERDVTVRQTASLAITNTPSGTIVAENQPGGGLQIRCSFPAAVTAP